MLNALRWGRARKQRAAQLCVAVSARAREPVFFRDFAVPDTIDGRFDLVALHAWLVLERLQAQGERELAQAFIDAQFERFDEGLRELGAGDMGMSRRMTKMSGAFYGRLEAYGAATDAAALADALVRNLYRGEAAAVEPARALAKYALVARARLAGIAVDKTDPDFGSLPVRA
jgi:cytochrome b pre-mRNA-processing protein 3